MSFERALALVLWKMRHSNPEMSVTITKDDIDTLEQCEVYQKLTAAPAVVEASGKMFVNMVVEGTADVFKAIESNEQDYQAAERAQKLRQARDQMPELVALVRGQMARGEFSESNITELIEAALLVARQ